MDKIAQAQAILTAQFISEFQRARIIEEFLKAGIITKD